MSDVLYALLHGTQYSLVSKILNGTKFDHVDVISIYTCCVFCGESNNRRIFFNYLWSRLVSSNILRDANLLALPLKP
jgi:hypothetical protein